MQTQLRLVVGVAVLALGLGCADKPIHTHIDSLPTGARIEVNENSLGPAPVDVVLRQSDSHRLKNTTVIRAIQADGQVVREKVLYYRQDVPASIVLDMNAPQAPPSPMYLRR